MKVKDFNRGEAIMAALIWSALVIWLCILNGCATVPGSPNTYEAEPPFVDVWCEGAPPIYGDDC
jgi:hypothetical protein